MYAKMTMFSSQLPVITYSCKGTDRSAAMELFNHIISINLTLYIGGKSYLT